MSSTLVAAAAEPGLAGSVGPRYFGFVIGGALDAATAAEIVAAGWDQNGFTTVMSPAALAAEDAAGTWLKELLALPGARRLRDGRSRPTPSASLRRAITSSPRSAGTSSATA